MKKAYTIARLAACCWLPWIALPHLVHAQETPFMHTSTAFFQESEVFGKESSTLIDNTQSVDNALNTVDTALVLQHNIALALKKLDGTLTSARKLIVVAKQIPQTRAQAEKLAANLDQIQPAVSRAAANAERVDLALEPTRIAVAKAEHATAMALEYEGILRDFGLAYFAQAELLVQCTEARPELEPAATQILERSRMVFSHIDSNMHTVNRTYDATVQAPGQAVLATIDAIAHQIDQLKRLLASVEGLYDQLAPLNDPLAELEKILDQSVGFDFQYPCGAKICKKSTPYPCGVKTCHKWGAPYPCGTKICHKDVPYPCGVQTCNSGVHMSISTVMEGADAIEHKIEALLSSTAWTALKAIGVKQFVDQLKGQADRMLNPVLSKLHLDINPNLPDLNLAVDSVALNNVLARLDSMTQGLNNIAAQLNLNGPTFSTDIGQVNGLRADLENNLRIAGCAPQSAPPLLQRSAPRINWRTGQPFVPNP